MTRLLKPLKKLPNILDEIRTGLDKNKYSGVNLYFQDESRFGLMTRQKRVLISKGIQPVCKYQHSYKWLWLWGCFSPITGDSFYWETSLVSNDIFEKFLESFAKQNPKELKIMLIDNAGFHACQNIKIPENVKLIRIPPYAPELNPAEKVWQWMKDRVAMKFFESTKDLQDKITCMVHQLTPELIKAITAYNIYTELFYEKF